MKVSLILIKFTQLSVYYIIFIACHEEMNKGNALVSKITNVNKKLFLLKIQFWVVLLY
jgi:hypothetical protein